ncbi:DNA integrity scanning protein DisA nucleotide-binding domain protein [Bacillus thuringiensis]|uniref:DNA integrity scanning protein DisA nucleotide-binding domain protein n=1 Tax=Bacillus thuringiensis TaxID=1428 RepID=UPI001F510F2B|nr:DNA integrity scanning protein DisA nucleotide-binding domain protein [Bacillus thuringiensis]MCU4722017.1 DNA integrity scanning protein DisA nucleotide-binding domain protein [Bacillus cereus]
MYVWGYQPYFQVSINNTAKEIFNNIRVGLDPKVWVVGIWNEEKGRENPNKVDVVTRDTPFEMDLFSRINDIACEIYNENTKNFLFGNEFAEERYHKIAILQSKANAISKILNEEYIQQNQLFFVARPVEIRGYLVFVILQLNNEEVSNIPSLTKNSSRGFKINTSFFEATVFEFLSSCIEVLNIPDIGEGLRVLRRASQEFIKSGAETFLNSLLFQYKGQSGLYESFNLISSQYYEGAEANGGIIIGDKNTDALNQVIEFKEPINLSHHRAIRKLLEMTNEKTYLLADGEKVYGLGHIKEYDPALEEIFIIKFQKHFLWQLVHANQVLMEVEYRHPRIPKDKINRESFADNFYRIFSNVTEDEINTVWDTIVSASNQKHGTMVVITNKAKEEAERLGSQCLKIAPTYIDSEIMELVTSIDGAVLIEPNGQCVALGVILDGISTNRGDSSRGARYNSALRYLETQTNECLIIVISEDGYINLIPNLAPRVPREWIDDLVKDLYIINESEEIDVKLFNQTMSKIQNLKFYLLTEDCNIVNELRRRIEDKMVTTFKIIYQDFKMNKEMNETYYL